MLIYNLLGQNILEVKGNTPQSQLNISNLQNGVCFLEVTINDGEKTFRLVKE